MYTLKNEVFSYTLDDQGRNSSFLHLATNHEFVEIPGTVWKLIYSVPGTERVECVVWQNRQQRGLPPARMGLRCIAIR